MSHGKMSDFVSFPLFGFTLVIKLRNFDFKSHLNVFIFFDKERYGVRFEYAPWKNVWFCFISIVWVHFSHKIEKFRFESHRNTLLFLNKKKDMLSDFNMSHGKMSDFVSFPLFGFTLVIKLRNFDFESHWNILIFFDNERHGVRFEYVSRKSVWFCFHWLVSL